MKTLKEIISRLKVFMPENKLYVGVWIFAVLIILAFNIQNETTHKFVGVTDSKEVSINSKYPVIIKSINVNAGQSVQSGQLLLELESEELENQISEVNIRLKALENKYKRVKKESLKIQVSILKNKLDFLNKEKEELYVFSTFDGHVGAVNFNNGASVPPFDPIVTMHKTTPTFVRGYVHENLSHEIKLNKKVEIKNLNSKQKVVGVIKKVGSRIVEFPERFRRSIDAKIWGREVVVQLPKNNTYLLGEKVFMEVGNDDYGVEVIGRSVADEELKLEPTSYNLIPIQRGVNMTQKIEPSGLVYIKDYNKFLMVSDDNKNDKPLVYLLNANGQLDSHVITIDGLKEIKDMESIVEDELGNIYVSSSLSPTKEGKISKKRNIIAKLKRDGFKLSVISKINLYDELDRLVQSEEHQELDWVKFLNNKKNSKGLKLKSNNHKLRIDIEGLIVRSNTIYLGLRNPIKSSKEVIVLKIANSESVFEGNTITSDQVSIWKKITLPVLREADRDEGISDMMFKDGVLYFLTASNKHKRRGRLLKVGSGSKIAAKELVHFTGYRPEGLAFCPNLNKLVVSFDNNEGESLYMATVPLL